MAYPNPPQYAPQYEGQAAPLLPAAYAPPSDGAAMMAPVMALPVNAAAMAPMAPVAMVPAAGPGLVVVVSHNNNASNSPAGALPAPAGHSLVPRAFDHPIADTYSPHTLSIVHKQPLSDNWPCFQCNPLCAPCALMSGNVQLAISMLTCQSLCDYCCWESKLKPRAYAVVHENRIEFNYPYMSCCGCCTNDNVSVAYFDQIGSLTHADCCTPYHCCWCLECTGGVVARAPCYAVNCPLCACCRCYYPGLSNPQLFMAAYQQAKAATENKQRMVMARA